MNTCEFSRLVGFNISERQVRYANERAIRENVAHKLSFAWEKPNGFPASQTDPRTGSWRSSARSTSIARASTGERRRS